MSLGDTSVPETTAARPATKRGVAWDRDRPVPWKRLFVFVGIYSLIVFGLFAVLQPDRMLQSLPGLVFGAGVALIIMAVLSKFGWQPTMLKSKEQIAADRAAREQARAAGKSERSPKGTSGSTGGTGDAPAVAAAPRAKPAPTRRTSTGATNYPRRTRDTRKR
jgi:hypothetical protein